MERIRLSRSILAMLNSMLVRLPDGSYIISDTQSFDKEAGSFDSIKGLLEELTVMYDQNGVKRSGLNAVISGKHKTRIVTGDYDVVGCDCQLLVLPQSSDINITLPKIADYPRDSLSRTTRIIKLAGTYDVIVKPQAGESFLRGMSSYRIIEPGQFIQFIAVNAEEPEARKWITYPTDMQALEVVNSAPLDGDDFAAGNYVPFDTALHSDNPDIMEYAADAPAGVECKIDGEYSFNYWVSINKSGAGAWSANVQLHKNGSPLSGTLMACTGQGSNADASVSLPLHVVDLQAGDRVSLHLTIGGSNTSVVSSGMSARVRV